MSLTVGSDFVVWSRPLLRGSDGTAPPPTTLRFSDGVNAATLAWLFVDASAVAHNSDASAGTGGPRRMRCVVIVHGGTSLCVLGSTGSAHDVSLPFTATRLIALETGVLLQTSQSLNLPTWFSLFHALEAPTPVAVTSSAVTNTSAASQFFLGGAAGERLLAAADEGGMRLVVAGGEGPLIHVLLWERGDGEDLTGLPHFLPVLHGGAHSGDIGRADQGCLVAPGIADVGQGCGDPGIVIAFQRQHGAGVSLAVEFAGHAL